MGKENIEKYSARYTLFKKAVGFWHDKVFYRKIIVMGAENINPDDHLIFAPNHQNALMDALAVLFTHKGQPVFLARADIFKRKAIASFLYFIKILPVYRIRDGFSSLKANDEIFLKTIDVLKNKNGLVILPEGDHAGFRRLRQLKKGICRVAFQADEATGFQLKIKIIPVGIEYSNYSRLRQVITVIYGKPIEVSEYYQLYKDSPERALNTLRDRLSTEIKKVMVHIESEDDYEAIDELRSIINGRYSDNIKFPKLYRDRSLIDKLKRLKISDPQTYNKICALSIKVKEKAKYLNITYRLLEKKKHPLIWLIAGLAGLFFTFPVWLFGNIFTLTFLSLPELQIRKTKDLQFHSTIRFGISLALAFIFLPVYLIITLLIFSPWWLAIVIFLTIPVAGIFAWNYNILFRRIIGGFRLRKYIKEKNSAYSELRKNYDELIELVSTMKDE
ncbi:MAG: 1-acyl-sn-glycerol-3-phosphate acyltransferase [Bacteroidia bacterium]|nr:1-acyl-sn-glycerol-3-phosphate acyltransferase [Bacteroidia bacterium]